MSTNMRQRGQTPQQTLSMPISTSAMPFSTPRTFRPSKAQCTQVGAIDMIEAAGANVLFLPAYWPDLNSIRRVPCRVFLARDTVI
jgi:hypothetical protein